ncbi:Ribosome-releasing factor 2, mitochondrial [Oleoguttula sp. CCFEE 5521]
MILRWLCRQRRPFIDGYGHHRRQIARDVSTKASDEATIALDRTRNIGIIAHIDAGKTTTTERMLYYSGFSRRLGDVDDGSTITDFLPAERARGITIQSAAITFSWPPSTGKHQPPAADTPRSANPHTINLIDTPGHADFTFEVLRSLRVLDGAVCILDGVAGVEAQTEKVWTQAGWYRIPRIIFVSKLDRDGATFARTVQEIGSKLNVWPAICGMPWWSAEGKLIGVGDVVGLRCLRYAEGGDGKDVQTSNLNALDDLDAKFGAELRKARVALVELLSEHDDEMVEHYLEANEDHLAISSEAIIASLRRCTLHPSQAVVPVFAGASFRNIGVQPLLDAVVDLLPSPLERPDPDVNSGLAVSGLTLTQYLNRSMSVAKTTKPSLALQQMSTATALAFKVTSHPRHGVLVYVRVYSGTFTRNMHLWNTTLSAPERAQKVLRMYADDAVDVDEIASGSIGVIPGLKVTRTGDTLVSMPPGANPKNGPPEQLRDLQLQPIHVPPPVFFVSVEANSLAEERHVRGSLELLLREDPSLHVTLDEESGQTHLSGMGELHLEIARDRLVQDLKAKARIGDVEIGYREAVTAECEEIEEFYDRDVAGKSSRAGCTVSICQSGVPLNQAKDLADSDQELHTLEMPDENLLYVIIPPPTALPTNLPTQTLKSYLRTGVLAALARGPTHGFPMHSTKITLTLDHTTHLFPNTSLSAISSVARLAVAKALRASAKIQDTVLMEPVMSVRISVPEENLGAVVQDLSAQRGGSVASLDADGETSYSADAAARIIDVSRIYTPPDPFGSSPGSGTGDALLEAENRVIRVIKATVPLREMIGYLKHLRSLSGGRGTFTMDVDRFEKMGGVRMKAVLEAMGRGM